jgi:glutathione S-transferase
MSLRGRGRLCGMKLYYHPRSPYSHKVMIALAEKRAPYTPVSITPGDELAKLTPIGKVPLLVLDDGWKIPESTIIIEYLDTQFSTGTRLIPEDRDQARQTRFHDRLADLYVAEPTLKILFDGKKPEAKRDPEGVAAAHARLDALFTGLDEHLAKRTWIMGDGFTMADCALIPPLGYARTLHPFDKWKHVSAYVTRAMERPSVKQVHEVTAPSA